MGTTTNYSLRFPDRGQTNAIHTHFENLADDVDAALDGIEGGTGTPGADGASAYEVAVANGFVGTEAEWLASLVGAEGDDGVGVPVGGSTGQVLTKVSGTDFDTEWATPSGGGTTPTREDEVVTSTSLADGAEWSGTATLAAGYRLLKVETDRAARVRLYDSTAARTADAARAIGVDPSGAHGVILDFVTAASVLEWWVNPVVDGYTVAGDDAVPVLVTNLSGATGTVTVTLTWVRSE